MYQTGELGVIRGEATSVEMEEKLKIKFIPSNKERIPFDVWQN